MVIISAFQAAVAGSIPVIRLPRLGSQTSASVCQGRFLLCLDIHGLSCK